MPPGKGEASAEPRGSGGRSRGRALGGVRELALLASLLVAGFAAISVRWLHAAPESIQNFGAGRVVLVSNSDDMGIGSLRQAIYDANLAGGRARVEFRIRRVVVRSPLPPLVNPRGIVLDGAGQVEIRAELPEDAPLFDASSPRVLLAGLKLLKVGGSVVLVRGGTLVLKNVEISDSGIGLEIGESVREILVEKSTFERNKTGILMMAGPAVAVRESVFRQHQSAGIWATTSSPFDPRGSRLLISNNRFAGDRIGVGLINVGSQVSGNRFENCRECAIFLSGRGAEVRSNRVRSGAIGIEVEEAHGAVLEDNEIDHNANFGIMLRSSSQALLRANRLHANGYGVAVILGGTEVPNLLVDNVLLGQKIDGLFVLGESPRLSNNQVLGSGAAGLRVLDYVPKVGTARFSTPRLENNQLSGNGFDEPVHGRYQIPGGRAQGP